MSIDLLISPSHTHMHTCLFTNNQYILDSKSASHIQAKDIISNSTEVEVTSARDEGKNAVEKADDGSCDDSSSDDEL